MTLYRRLYIKDIISGCIKTSCSTTICLASPPLLGDKFDLLFFRLQKPRHSPTTALQHIAYQLHRAAPASGYLDIDIVVLFSGVAFYLFILYKYIDTST